MRIEPKSAGAFSAGAFIFLLIFGVGWPGPGTWLLVFALLFIAAGAAAWWLDGTIVPAGGGGAMAATVGGSPFSGGGRPATLGRRGRPSESWLLSLGLPGPDGRGRWVLPNRVHVTLVAGAVGLLAMIIFIGGAINGGSAVSPDAVPAVQPNEALDFAQPITPAIERDRATPAVEEARPIQLETPAAARPELPRPADPIEAVGAPTTPARTEVHEVVSGDTIYDLAITYGSSIEAIMNANGIGEYDTIRVGDQLIIPIQRND